MSCHGKSCHLHSCASSRFCAQFAPFAISYFRQSKFPSFQRQLNLYGFRRLAQGTYGLFFLTKSIQVEAVY